MTAGTSVPTVRRRLRVKAPAPGSITKATPTSSSVLGSPYTISEQHDDYVVVAGALDSAILERLEAFLRRKRPKPAHMKNEGGDSDDERKARYDDRDSNISWFRAETDAPYLHNRFRDVLRKVGNIVWPLLSVKPNGSLKCEWEATQYAVYGPNQHFQAWHQDAYAEGTDPEDARQFTIVAMLTDRKDYTGGNFQVKVPGPIGRKVIRNVRMNRGDVIVFPAKKLEHRVTAVKTGIRRTLVFWALDKESSKYHHLVATGEVKRQVTAIS